MRSGSHTCHGALPLLVQRLQPLLVLERVHRRPEPLVALSEDLPRRQQPLQRFLDEVLARAKLVEELPAEDEVAAVDPDVGPHHVAHGPNPPVRLHRDHVEAVVRAHREKARHRVLLPGAGDHPREIGIRERVPVVGEEELVVGEVVADGTQPLADRRPRTRIDEGDVPVVDVGLQQVHVSAAVREDEVVRHRLVVGEEELLDRLGLVAEAEHEVGEAEVCVVLHHVPEDRPAADRDHRLRSDLGRLSHPQPLAAAEDDDLHSTSTSGIGTTKRAPHSRAWSSWATISSFRFHGRIRMKSGRACSSASGWRIGMWVPGRNCPCLYGLRSTVNSSRSVADAAVVEQRVPLAGRPVAGDPLAVATALDQELEQPPLGLHDTRRERAVPLEPVEPERALPLRHLRHPRALGLASARPSLRVDAAASRRGWELVDVEDLEAVGPEHRPGREEREVREVLVVDRVELVARHQPRQVRELDRDHALGREHPLDAADEVVQVGDVRQHVVGDEQVRPPALGGEAGRLAPGRRTRPPSRSPAPAPPRRRWRRARRRAPVCPARRRAGAGSRRCWRAPPPGCPRRARSARPRTPRNRARGRPRSPSRRRSTRTP